MWSKNLNENKPIILPANEWDAINWAFPCESDVSEHGRAESFLRFDATGLTIDLQHGSTKGAQITDLLVVCYLYLVKLNRKDFNRGRYKAILQLADCLDLLNLDDTYVGEYWRQAEED